MSNCFTMGTTCLPASRAILTIVALLVFKQCCGFIQPEISLRNKHQKSLPLLGFSKIHRRANNLDMALSNIDTNTLTTTAAVGAGLCAVGLVGFQTAIYWRMQFITAAMLSRRVGGEALDVTELGARDCKNLYYYPQGAVASCNLVGDNVNQMILSASERELGVKIRSKPAKGGQAPIDSSSQDIVVCVNGLKGATGSGSDVKSTILEANRLLRQGGSFIFVDKLSDLSENNTQDPGELFSEKTGFEKFECDLVQNIASPYVVGLAVKTKVSSAVVSAKTKSEGNRQSRRSKSKGKKSKSKSAVGESE